MKSDGKSHIAVDLCALPTEILSKICEMFFYEEEVDTEQQVIRLSSINRRFQNITTQNPRLWTKVLESSRPEITKLCIERSFPLNLNVYMEGVGYHRRLFSQIEGHLLE